MILVTLVVDQCIGICIDDWLHHCDVKLKPICTALSLLPHVRTVVTVDGIAN